MVPDQWEVNKDHLVISKTLGEGAFGRVMMGILEKDGVKTKVACKMLKGRSSMLKVCVHFSFNHCLDLL